jgi:hypothetical protein
MGTKSKLDPILEIPLTRKPSATIEKKETKPTQAAPVKKKMDISEINWNSFGTKKPVSQSSSKKEEKKDSNEKSLVVVDPPPPLVAVALAEASAATELSPKEEQSQSQQSTSQKQSVYEEEVKKYAKLFNKGLKHLQYLIEMASSSLSALESSVVMSEVKESSSSSNRCMIIDLGIEAINLPRNMNIFNAKGFQFLVEIMNTSSSSTLSSSSSLQSITKEPDTNATTTTSKGVKPSTSFHQKPLHVSTSVDSLASKSSSKKRLHHSSKSHTIIIAGGHYEHVIEEYKNQFKSFESWTDSISSVYACATLFFLQQILSTIQKTSSLSSKAASSSSAVLAGNALSTKGAGKKGAQTLSTSSSSLSWLQHHQQLLKPLQLKVLVLSSQQLLSPVKDGGNDISSSANNTSLSAASLEHLYGIQYKPFHLKGVIKVLELLRSYHVMCSGYLTQLHGYFPNLSASSKNIFELFHKLNVSHVVIVDSNSSNSSNSNNPNASNDEDVNEVLVQVCGCCGLFLTTLLLIPVLFISLFFFSLFFFSVSCCSLLIMITQTKVYFRKQR